MPCLSHGEVITLHQYLEGKKEEIRARRMRSDQVARMATDDLGLKITRRNILGLMGTQPTSVISYNWRYPSENGKQRSQLRQRVDMLEERLEHVDERLRRIEQTWTRADFYLTRQPGRDAT